MTQFCIEEAVFERLHFEEMLEKGRGIDTAGGEPEDPALQMARDFAEGRI